MPADRQSFRPLLARKRFEAAGLGSSRIRIAYSVELNRDNTAAPPDNSTVAFSASRKQVGRR